MEIELPDGTILDAPDDADPSAVAKAYLAKQQPRRSPLEYASGLAAAANQGMTLGFADEIQAGGESLLNSLTGGRVGAPYRQSLERQRKERAAFAGDNPWASGLATGAGAVVPGALSAGARLIAAPATNAAPGAFQLLRESLFGGGAPVRPVNTVVDAVREGARAGAVPGFVAGAGTAEPGQRLEGAILGGGMGAAVGGAVGGAMQGANWIMGKATPWLRKVVDSLNVDNAAGVSRVAPAGPTQPTSSAPITAAEARILRAMEEGGVSPEDAAMALRRARELNVPLGLVDVGGQPLQRVARGARTAPGEGSAILDDALTGRAAGQTDRVISQLERGFGRTSTSDAGSRADALLSKARSDSSPLYRDLAKLPDIDDPVVSRIMQTPFVRQKFQDLEAARASLGQPVLPLYDEAGNFARPVTFRDVDAAKQLMDETLRPVYQQGPRPPGSVDISSRQFRENLQGIRRELVSAADAAPGGELYARARSSYAGPAQARDAFEAGRELIRRPTEIADVRAELRGASPAERKWYERGAIEALRGKIESTPDLTGNRNVLSSFYGNRADRAKVLEVVNPRRRGLLDEALMLENRAAQTRNFVQSGSQTADKAAELLDQTTDLATDVATGNKLGAFRGALQWLSGKVGRETNAAIARQLANFDNPEAQQAFLQRLIELRRIGALQAQDVAATARAMAVQTRTEGE
jgi:hypothetical protein